jgi:hypothetical protein
MSKYQHSDEEEELYLPDDGELPAGFAPDTDPDYARRYKAAQKHVQQIKEFYGHVAVYIMVNGFLLMINILTTSFPWVLFPIGGWGIGLLAHAFDVYGTHGIFGYDWEERKIREIMGEKPKRD